MAGEISYAVSTAGADKLFLEMEQLSGKPVGKIVRQRSGLLARLLASYTQPVVGSVTGAALSGSEDAGGMGPQARNLGKAAVIRDVSRVYTSPQAVYMTIRGAKGIKRARQFAHLVKVGELEQARALLQSLAVKGSALMVVRWDGGARHKQMRNSRGRINRGTKPMVVDDPQALKDFKKKKVNQVGFSKSTWITAARGIPDAQGLSRVPAWIRKHSAPGTGIDKTRGDNPHVILRSNLRWMDSAFSARTNNALFKRFGDLIVLDLTHAIEALKRKTASQANTNNGGARAAKAA